MSVTSLARRYRTVLRGLNPEALAAMRQVTRINLQLWHKEELAGAAELGVTELLTNVLLHAGGDCELLLHETDDGVVVEVTDFDERLPVVKPPTDDEPGGRGLFLLSQLADDFHIRQLARGMQVQFRLAVAPEAEDA